MQQTELHSRHLIDVEVPVTSLLLNTTDTINVSTIMHYTIKRGRVYHKTIAVLFASRLFQIGENQWPHCDDVGYNIHNMRHTQVISQGDFPQSGATGHPISCLSASQPIDYKFGHGKPVQRTEHTGRCPLQTAFEQTQIEIWVVN